MQYKRFTLQTTPELSNVTDRLKLYRIDNNDKWHLEIETDPHPSLLTKLLCKLGLVNYAGDAVTNYFLTDQAAYQIAKYLYCSVGTDGTNGSVYTYSDLITPVMSRVATTNTTTTSYITNDTAQFLAVITCDGDYVLQEAGLHTASTSGYMGARQTFASWSVENGERIGAIWEIINNRS